MEDEKMVEVAYILLELPSLIFADESRKRGLLEHHATPYVFPKIHMRKRSSPPFRKDCESSRVHLDAPVQSRVSTEATIGDFLAGRTSTYLRFKKPVETENEDSRVFSSILEHMQEEELKIPELPSEGADPSWPRLPGLELDVEESSHANMKPLEQEPNKLSNEELAEALSLISRKKVVIDKGLDEALRFYQQLMEHGVKLELKEKEEKGDLSQFSEKNEIIIRALGRAERCYQQLKGCRMKLDHEEAETKQCPENEGGDLIPSA